MLAIVIADRKAGNSFREAGVQFLKTRRRVPKEKTMAMSMGGGGASGPQMNVTPLIDVLLVLIIIFMVIVAKSKEGHFGLEAQIPQPPAHPDSEPPRVRTIVIQIAEPKNEAVPELKINEQPVSWSGLEPQLADIFKQRAEKVAFVQGDDDVEFKYVAYVIDTARAAGVDRVGLLPKELARR
jgi:biopolymer transport protein TolR